MTYVDPVTAGGLPAAGGVIGHIQADDEVVDIEVEEAALNTAVKDRGAWQPTTAYAVNDQVTVNNLVYLCTTAHTSGASFAGTDWSQRGVQAGAYAPVGLVDGIPLTVYGHSFTTANGYTALTPGAAPVAGRPSTEPWPNRAARRTGMQLANRGVGGDMMRDTYTRMLGNGATVWTPGATGVLLIESMLNDLRFGGPDPLQRQAFRNSLTSCIAVGCAGALVLPTDPSITRTGTWASIGSSTITIGGTVYYSTTNGDHFSISFTGDEITVFLAGLDSTITGGSATVAVTIDGTAAVGSPFNGNNQMRADTGALVSTQEVPIPLRFHGLGSGAHTLVVTKTDATGSYFYCGGYVQPAAVVAANRSANVPESPTVLVCKDPDLGATSYALAAPYNQGTSAARASYAADIDTVVALFDGVNGCAVKAVDLAPGYPPGGCLADGIHPDDVRVDVLASNCVPALTGLAVRGGFYVGS